MATWTVVSPTTGASAIQLVDAEVHTGARDLTFAAVMPDSNGLCDRRSGPCPRAGQQAATVTPSTTRPAPRASRTLRATRSRMFPSGERAATPARD